MDTQYMVLRVAVYIHDVFGPFATFDAARARADLCAAMDHDAHHNYEVHAMSAAGMSPPVHGEGWPRYEDRDEPLYYVRSNIPRGDM